MRHLTSQLTIVVPLAIDYGRTVQDGRLKNYSKIYDTKKPDTMKDINTSLHGNILGIVLENITNIPFMGWLIVRITNGFQMFPVDPGDLTQISNYNRNMSATDIINGKSFPSLVLKGTIVKFICSSDNTFAS